jgi:hypothetical protein
MGVITASFLVLAETMNTNRRERCRHLFHWLSISSSLIILPPPHQLQGTVHPHWLQECSVHVRALQWRRELFSNIMSSSRVFYCHHRKYFCDVIRVSSFRGFISWHCCHSCGRWQLVASCRATTAAACSHHGVPSPSKHKWCKTVFLKLLKIRPWIRKNFNSGVLAHGIWPLWNKNLHLWNKNVH